MPRTNDTEHAKPARPHRARRTTRTKPAFEIPVESAAPEAAAAWVDRSADTPKSETTYQEERRHLLTEDGHEENRLVNAGMTVLSFGLVVLTQVTVTALGILAAPLRFGRRFIPGITPRRG